MKRQPLFTNLARCATARAHLAGAEEGDAARARYWRELAAVSILTGFRWPAAEQLGGQT